MQVTIDLKKIKTPIGTMIACAVKEGLCLLEFEDRRMLPTEMKQLSTTLNASFVENDNIHFEKLEQELNDYFAGRLKQFSVPLMITGSGFQKQVWQVLQTILYGKTTSYKEQAIAVGNVDSIRAVAHANGMNKIAIIIPCHRVIGSNGELTGYGGGIWRKKFLLELEKTNGRQLKLIE